MAKAKARFVLPPLPQIVYQPTNLDRAQWALRAVAQFARDTGLETEGKEHELATALGDLLASMMHLCDSNLIGKVDFDERLKHGREFYQEEAEDSWDDYEPTEYFDGKTGKVVKRL